ncbi:hypothetical protein M3Y95_00555200 [Aphelenchoides besseyi]|nr:hypothetical protein M3Y95_00555200 [Aphelenchoides besseyi]
MEVERKAKIERSYVGRYFFDNFDPQFCIDGRFVFGDDDGIATILDLFHSKDFLIPIQINLPVKQGRERWIGNTIFLDLNTVLVVFTESNDYKENCYLGIGKNNQQKITVESAGLVYADGAWMLIGQTSGLNLRDGVYALYVNFEDDRRYAFNMKTNQNGEVCLSQSIELPIGITEFGLFDGHIYGFLDKTDTIVPDLSKIVKVSVESGEQELLPTTNSAMLFEDGYDAVGKMICVGWKVYVSTRSGWEDKSRLVTLNLESLEWSKTELEFDGWIQWLTSDGKRALIVGLESACYRFIVEQPDSLWNLVSMAIKQQSDSNPRYPSCLRIRNSDVRFP